jgi:UDP-N-acetylglucosamine transferase subunit ALG13
MSPSPSPSPGSTAVRRRICLAASGGGHVRQLLDLQPVWSEHDYFFVTEDTALGRSLAEQHPTHFLPHFAWGQAKQGHVLRMLSRAAQSFFQAFAILRRERPGVVISTGAGAVFPIVFWARLMGARVIVIESFARFEKPSLFGRMAAPFANLMVVQSAKLAKAYPKAKVFDPLRLLDSPAPPKKPLLFATVGATLPFDRLVRSVAELKAEGEIPEQVIIQTGTAGLAPEGLETHETLPFEKVQALLADAAIVVCHGGTGSLITALRQGCQVIAMPRLFELGEHYDNHQAEITEAFVQRGLILSARNVDELREALAVARTRKPVLATTDPVALTAFLREALA